MKSELLKRKAVLQSSLRGCICHIEDARRNRETDPNNEHHAKKYNDIIWEWFGNEQRFAHRLLEVEYLIEHMPEQPQRVNHDVSCD